MPLHLTDGIILGILLVIIAGLLSRVAAKVRGDFGKVVADAKLAGGGGGKSADHQGTQTIDIAHRDGGVTR